MSARLECYRPAPFPRPRIALPLCRTRLCAGFPSPADDHAEQCIDLNEALIRNEVATFLYRVIGHSGHDSLRRDGFVRDGDIIVVDRSVEARNGDTVIVAIDGENCLKRYCQQGKRTWLESANSEYAPVTFGPESELKVEGVVMWSIHKQRSV